MAAPAAASVRAPGTALRALTPLAAGHFVTDLAQGALPALLPFLKTRFHLSYLEVGAIVLSATVASSVVQPAFGHWSDRRGASWLLPAGPLVAGVGLCLLGVAPSYPVVLACVLLSGIGVAAFHPEATKFAAWVSGERRSTAMAVFSVGGNAGIAAGPLIAGALASAFGLVGVVPLVIPGVVVAIALTAVTPRLLAAAESGRVRAARAAGEDDWHATVLLLAAVTARGYVHFGLLSFIPLFEGRVRHHSDAYGAALLTVMLGFGAIGTLVLGPLADRIGRREALLASMAVCIPSTAVYVSQPGAAGIAALAITGACIVSTFGVTIVLSQEYLPARVGMAAGLSVGLSIGLGGIAALAVGALADSFGLQDALWTIPAAAVVGTVLGALLSAPGARARQLVSTA